LDGFTQEGMAPVGGDRRKGQKDKGPLRQPWMGHGQIWGANDAIAIEQQI